MMKMKIDEIENELNNLNDELDDVVENMIFMLEHNEIKDINILNFHFEIQHLLNKIDYLNKLKFNMKY